MAFIPATKWRNEVEVLGGVCWAKFPPSSHRRKKTVKSNDRHEEGFLFLTSLLINISKLNQQN